MSLNILWQLENTPNSNLYIDIFAVEDSYIITDHVDKVVNDLFEESKLPKYQKNNTFSKIARDYGRSSYGKGEYFEAMNHFSNCLSAGENGSPDIGVAFSNRAACFFELNMYKEALIDIELAKKFNPSETLLSKLNERAEKCKSLMNKEWFQLEQFKVREPQLSFNPHAKFNGVADCLIIQNNEEFGRHVITAIDLKVGQTILVENPYAIIHKRYYDKGRKRCLFCFKECMNFITCTYCVGALFCDDNCRRKSDHQYECNRPGTLSQTETFDLVLKMFIKIDKTFTNVENLMILVDMLLNGHDVMHVTNNKEREFAALFQLVHRHNKLELEHLNRLRSATNVAIVTLMRKSEFIRKYSTLQYQRFLQHLILHLFHIAEHAYELNEYTQEDSRLPMQKYTFEVFANAMYPFGCYINHSCVPNVFCFFVDGRLICKVIRPIGKGDQIFRSYISDLLPKPHDFPKLKFLFQMKCNFPCQCIICANAKSSQFLSKISFSENALYKEAVQPLFLTVEQIRQLPRTVINTIENRAIEFLEKYDGFHPNYETINIQGVLGLTWYILASRV